MEPTVEPQQKQQSNRSKNSNRTATKTAVEPQQEQQSNCSRTTGEQQREGGQC
jgi:hypothetical protein